AYGNTGTFEDVALHFGEAAEASAFVLYQNQPNPFRNETVIGFELPEAMPATVTISDVAGRVVRSYQVDGAKGYNQIAIKVSDLAATGVLSYTVSTEGHTATKKMVVAD
ncbi:MAG: T9SS type A sorting domain-containing protein, partial [bacterium]|nr:T9SS type A sorting domain-containing protein [bacterium]